MHQCCSLCNCLLVAALHGASISVVRHSCKLSWSLLRVYPCAKFDFVPWRNVSRALVLSVLEFLPCLSTPLLKEGRQRWPSDGSAHQEAKSIFCSNLVWACLCFTAQIPGFLKSLSIPTPVTPGLRPGMQSMKWDGIATICFVTRISKLLCTWRSHWFWWVLLDKINSPLPVSVWLSTVQNHETSVAKLQQCKVFPLK